MAGKYPNSGILSRDKNQKSDKHPEYTGSAEVDGVEYWMNAYINEGEHGKYFKISFKKKEPRQSGGGGQSQRSSGRAQHDDDDTPF